MTSYTITVEFTVDAGDMAAFMPLMLANARASLELEPGCERFDVLRPQGETDRVVLYEIYHDRAAFDLHVRAPHYLAFAAATEPLIRAKSVRVCEPFHDSSPVQPA
jgi:quinol monooxygenase YgiN